jgi:hypothetical protein
MMEMNVSLTSLIVDLIGVILFTIVVVVLIGGGWYIVWKLYLYRFNFLREILGLPKIPPQGQKHSTARSRGSAASTSSKLPARGSSASISSATAAGSSSTTRSASSTSARHTKDL